MVQQLTTNIITNMEGLEVRSCVGGYAHVSPAHEEVVTGRIALQVISS